MKDINDIQDFLKTHQIDGWLLYDFRGINTIAQHIAGFGQRNITRRWFCHIPSHGESVWLAHRIELSHFADVAGDVRTYMSWRELDAEMERLLSGVNRVAMEYSPNASIPYISRVDAGTLEWIRTFEVEVISSADLVQLMEARWSDEQLQGHMESARLILEAKDLAFSWIGDQIRAGRSLTEYDVQCFIMERFNAMNLTTYHPPIVAVNANSSDPHYAPTIDNHQPIRANDFVLIDLWAKQKTPGAVYADTTWVGYAGATVPDRYIEIFEIVRQARDKAVAFIGDTAAEGNTVYGYAVDDVVRNHIVEKGYGQFFFHRTGHSIGTAIHGNGVNIDHLETKDERSLIPRICFSIEPGIYLPEFGVRTEIDVFLVDLSRDGVIVTTVPVQNQVLTLL